VDGEGVALHLGTRRYYSVSASGLDLLEALTVPRTLAELVDVLTSTYDVSIGQATESAREFVEHGVRTGVLVAEEVP
jgi:hypothetical protein